MIVPIRIALLVAFTLAAVTVVAQEAEAPSVRFTLSTSEAGGFIRLDTQTGAVSHCFVSERRWRCESASEAPTADTEAMARIEARLLELQAQVGALASLDERLSAVEQRTPREAAELHALVGEVENLAEDIARVSDEVQSVREELPKPPAAEPVGRGFAAEAVSRLGRMVASLKRSVSR